MDQAHSLRKLVKKKNKLIFVLTSESYKYNEEFCQRFVKYLDKATYIKAEDENEVKEAVTQNEFDFYVVDVKDFSFLELFDNFDMDVIALTDNSNESILGIYSQIKLLLSRNIFNARDNIIKLVIGPVTYSSVAERTKANISHALETYLKYSVRYLGWFSENGESLDKVTLRYLESGGNHVENDG